MHTSTFIMWVGAFDVTRKRVQQYGTSKYVVGPLSHARQKHGADRQHGNVDVCTRRGRPPYPRSSFLCETMQSLLLS